MTLDAFEALVLSQRPASAPWAPCTDYSFEGRKKAEGIHPALILETFNPRRVLDVGCGFNYLARMINDAVEDQIAFGADVHNPAADYRFDIAADEVPYVGGDLVICREVLEHLTVLQIRRAVTNLCALSERFLYITTRFHQSPVGLLDVATSDDLDPTHISMCNKEFIRMLIVLEGFRRRLDLEAKMDWMGKDRVLIYERV